MNDADEMTCPACGWDADAEGVVLLDAEPHQSGDLFAYHKFYCKRCERRIFVEQAGFKTP